MTDSIEPSESFYPLEIGEFCHKWYGSNLKALDELSLFGETASSEKEVYRSLWLRSFRSTICIKVEASNNDRFQIFVKVLSRDITEDITAELIRDDVSEIARSDFEKLRQFVKEIGFSSQPTNEKLPIGLDGETWIFETLEERIWSYQACEVSHQR